MERGKPDLTVYAFEVHQGQRMQYPDNELWTLDYAEADAYAREKGYMLIGYSFEFEDSELIEDYTPKPECNHCVIKLNESDTGIFEDGDYPPGSDDARYCDSSPDHLGRQRN